MNEKRKEALTLEIPAMAVEMMLTMIYEQNRMHGNLIDMFRRETDLKKRHKAYLDLREEMEEVCRNDCEKLKFIKEFADQTKTAVNIMLREKLESEEEDEDYWDMSDDEEDGQNMVIVDGEDLDILTGDVVMLADTVDELICAFEELMNGGTIPNKRLERMLYEAARCSEEAYTDLEETEFEKLCS